MMELSFRQAQKTISPASQPLTISNQAAKGRPKKMVADLMGTTRHVSGVNHWFRRAQPADIP
jgi:hypothetical protein